MRWAVLAIVLAGCATAGPETARERTINDQVLAFDASKAAGGDPTCQKRRIASTEVSRPFQAGSRLPAGQWTERWTVDRCGLLVPYHVHYVRATDGHLGISIVRDQGLESVSVKGATLADRQLQHDTLVLLAQKDLSDTEGQPCRTRQVVNTEVLNPVTGGQVDNGRPVAGRWVERWTLDRCGVPVRYILEYTTTKDGTSFSAELEK